MPRLSRSLPELTISFVGLYLLPGVQARIVPGSRREAGFHSTCLYLAAQKRRPQWDAIKAGKAGKFSFLRSSLKPEGAELLENSPSKQRSAMSPVRHAEEVTSHPSKVLRISLAQQGRYGTQYSEV